MKTFILTLLLGAAIVGGEVWYFQKHPRPSPPPPEPELIATSPDGVKLWRVRPNDSCEWVYFSASGAEWDTHRDNGYGAGTVTTHHHTPNTKR